MKPIKVVGYCPDLVTGQNERYEEDAFLIAPNIALVPENYGTTHFVRVVPIVDSAGFYDDAGHICDVTVSNSPIEANGADLAPELALSLVKWAAGL
jgi:hypothetical protein